MKKISGVLETLKYWKFFLDYVTVQKQR